MTYTVTQHHERARLTAEADRLEAEALARIRYEWPRRMAVHKPPQRAPGETKPRRPMKSRGFQGSRSFKGEPKWKS